MKWLSRKEEFLLLVIMKLRDNAYGVTIRRHVAEATGKYWSIGAVYDALNRLARKGLVTVRTSAPLAERGGKARRYYLITRKGQKALQEIHAVQNHMWADFAELATE